MTNEPTLHDIHAQIANLYEEVKKLSSQMATEYLKPAEAATYLQVSEPYLAKLRCMGGGPTFIALGRRAVRYKRTELDEWASQHSLQHTSHLRARIGAQEPQIWKGKVL